MLPMLMLAPLLLHSAASLPSQNNPALPHASAPPAVRAKWKRGAIHADDYPSKAFRARAGGIVYLRFVVGPSGRVTSCTVTKSSGRTDLDERTCSLIKRRFRFRPAKNAEGEAVSDVIVGDHTWEILGRRR